MGSGMADAKEAKAGNAEPPRPVKKGGHKKVVAPVGKPDEDIHCHYCGTRESTYWRRGPDGPKTLCNSCGLNWFRQRPMQREQVEKNNLMAKAVAAAQLKRPANALKEGPEKRKREEKDGSKLREQLQGKRSLEAAQPRKKQKRDELHPGLKGLKRTDKASIGRKLGDAAVKKAALIKRTPSQLSLMGLLESAPAQEAVQSDAGASKPSGGVLKGARFSPLKQAQTLGAQKLLAVLNVIKQKKGFGRVTSTASLESVPEEDPSPGEKLSPSADLQMHIEEREEEGGNQDVSDVLTPRKTGSRTQRRPNTALLQGASFLPWKIRPRGWENTSLTFAAAESRLLKAQAQDRGRPPVLKRDELQRDGFEESIPQEEDGFAGYGVLRKLLEEAEVPGTSPKSKGRPPLNKKGGAGLPKPHAKPQLNSYESFEDLAGGMKRYESFEDLALRTGPVFSRIESFEELALKAQPSMRRFESFEDLAMRNQPIMRRFESFEDLAMRSEPVFEVPTLAAPRVSDAALDEGLRLESRREKRQKTWDWGKEKDKRLEEHTGEATGHFSIPSERPGEASGHVGSAGQWPVEATGHISIPKERLGEAIGDLVSNPGAVKRLTGGSNAGQQNARALIQPLDGRSNGRLGLGAPLLKGQAESAGLQTSLGSRGLSARALHLLVDCAVDTEPPPPNVNMIMQNLHERAALLQSRGLLAGPDEVSFALPNGQLLQQSHAIPARRNEGGASAPVVGTSAGPELKGDKVAVVGGSMLSASGDRAAAKGPNQKPQASPAETELHCTEELPSPEAPPCPGALPSALQPSEAPKKPGD